MDNFDICIVQQAYASSALKAPKAYTLALKTNACLDIFEDIKDAFHFFSTDSEDQRDRIFKTLFSAKAALVAERALTSPTSSGRSRGGSPELTGPAPSLISRIGTLDSFEEPAGPEDAFTANSLLSRAATLKNKPMERKPSKAEGGRTLVELDTK